MANEPSFHNDPALLQGSSFFDRDWYLATYKDVAEAGMDPVGHYLQFGAAEGRNPSPHFNTNGYYAYRPDIRAAAMNPLVHFLRYGLYEMADDYVSAGITFEDKELVAPSPAPLAVNGNRPLIVFVTHDMNIGGAPTLLNIIGGWFRRHTNFEIKFVSMGGGPLHERFSQVAPTHIVGGMTIPDDWAPGAKTALRDFLGREPAMTFLNSVASGDYFKINPYNTPVIAYIHEMKKVIEAFPSQFDLIIEKSAHIFCGSRTVYQMMRDDYQIDPERMTNRPAFIPTENLQAYIDPVQKQRLRRRLGLPAAKMVVACGVAHWRKQPDVFVRLAADLIKRRNLDLTFVWIGDGEDIPRVKALAQELEVGERIQFLGFRDNYKAYLNAGDVYALTSMEDPFPLVCLDAALGCTPSVIFREATGMTALVEPDGEDAGGIAVPLGDEAAYFDAVERMLRDDEQREAYARVSRERVRNRYSDNLACLEILGKIREVAKLRPHVSVVLPNYNCGPYLQERLDSIANQDFRDVEILLLDDKSTDGSENLLKDFAALNPHSRLILAEKNGGSVFAAWERGIRAANGELIWIAEADDFCETTFLSTAVRAFDTSGVHLVHGRSIPVTMQGEIAGDWNDLYLDRISAGRWRKSFVGPAAREINEALGRGNTIPNASAVLVRRDSALRAIGVTRHFRLAGDWAFYVVASVGGRIAYVHEAVNYHRRHDHTVTKSLEGKQAYFQELADVGALVRNLLGDHAERDASFRTFLQQEATRFHWTDALPEGRVPREIPANRVPGLLYGVGDLSEGGAQMFAIRLVNRWTEIPGSAVLFTTGQGPSHPTSIARLSPEVPLVDLEEITSIGLSQFMQDWGLDVIATGHWWADRTVAHWLDKEPGSHPWAVIMHGCYENVLDQPAAFPGFEADFAAEERNCDCWIWTAQKNRTVFDRDLINPRRSINISNGFEPVIPSGITRKDLGLPEDALVFILASRAIESKGWFATVEAFTAVRKAYRNSRDLRLLLIGNGPAADQLSHLTPADGIHLVGHTARLADYIAASDIGLLPSWFTGESLPLILIELLAQGKPAVVSDIGMCPWAIDVSSKKGGAGIVVPRDPEDGTVHADTLAQAIATFVEVPDLAVSLEPAARRAFRKFNMNHMIDRYRQLFEELV